MDPLGFLIPATADPQQEFCQMAQRLIPYESLKAKCIGYSKPHLWRLEKANKFPKRVPIGAGRYGYIESEIDDFVAQKIAERDARSAA
jgi:prophage regulatory protein